MRSWIGIVAVLVALTACSSPSEPSPTPGAAGTGSYRDLPTTGDADYQLGGAYDPPPGVTIVVRDSTAAPAAGRYSICYVNGFQTQPADADRWLSEQPDAILRRADGKPVIDPQWPDEMLLSTTTPAARRAIVDFLTPTIARCADRGFDAVEFDNLDSSWTRSDSALREEGNLALASSLVDVAHVRGLAVGQKNTPQLGQRGRDAGFDFAIAEECVAYRECDAYTDVYGPRVIDIEYTDIGHTDIGHTDIGHKDIGHMDTGHKDTGGSWAAVCARADRPTRTMLRDRDLVAAGQPGYVFDHC
ncbi:endo alpha-1,4 polygalactosaminidase [Gordonia soli]|nr:endo alpha-1,4 polygalactosaminidase [Gordonia soli]